MDLKWLPNALTIARCLLAGVVLWSCWKASVQFSADTDASFETRATLEHLWAQLALLAFVAGALTDFGDGVLARALNAHSRFGVWLDPIADKLLVAGALIGLWLMIGGLALAIPALIIIARDIGMTMLRMTRLGQSTVAVSAMAKWKTTLEMIAIAALLVPLALAPREAEPATLASSPGPIAILLVGLLWIAAALSVYTALQYIVAARRENGNDRA